LRKAGHPEDHVQLCLDRAGPVRMMFLAPTDEQAHDEVQEVVDGYLEYVKRASAADRREREVVGKRPVFQEREDLLDRAVIWGGPDKVASELAAFQQEGLRQVARAVHRQGHPAARYHAKCEIVEQRGRNVKLDKVERNIQHFKRFQQEVAVEGNFTDLHKLMAPQILVHRPANITLLQLNGVEVDDKPVTWNRDDFKKNWKTAMAGRVDHRRVVDEIYGIGDVVCARWSIEWTHAETIQGIPPSGRRIHISEAGIMHYDDEGRMKEGWFIADQLELFLQLGAKVTVTADRES
jgi:hypothetical protein